VSRRLLRAGGALTTGALAAVTARAAYAALNQRPPGGREAWARTNHRGEPVTLLEGPAAAAAAAVATLIAPRLPARSRAALALAGAGAAAFGALDDLKGSGDRRGFRGHLGALAHGEVTSGAVKIAGIGATGLTAGMLIGGSSADGSAAGTAVDIVINTGLIAGGANLLNLFDLRPGRAIKVALAAGTALGAGSVPGCLAAAAPVGAALAVLPEDLGERAMLGDSGANALGGMLGAAAATALPRTARVTVLAAIVGLTAASEVVSFTRVIERTPPLRWLDMLGRRPAGAAGQGAASAASAPGEAARQPAASAPGEAAGEPAASAPGEAAGEPAASAPGDLSDVADGVSGADTAPDAGRPGRSDGTSAPAPTSAATNPQ
jgi:UDP-GlcNAc:undecaprenyl-phosphate/decaprenyl-phosphate GlcNAc-1-phosphate transferase